MVQVGAFADAGKARETRLKVEKAGLKTYTHVAETKEGKRIRVRVGPFATRGRGGQGRRQDQGAGFAGRHPHLVGGAMAALDWVFLAVLLASLLLGPGAAWCTRCCRCSSWIAAFVLAQWFAPQAAAWLPMGTAARAGAVCGGVRAWCSSRRCSRAACWPWLTKKLIEAVGLRPVDRTLGAAFGLVRGVVLAAGGGGGGQHDGAQAASSGGRSRMGAGVSTAALKGLKPVLPERFGQYLPG